MNVKRFRMYGGPNGSGKSTLINFITENYNIGFSINADVIEAKLKNQSFINCKDYLPKIVTNSEWNQFQSKLTEDSRFKLEAFSKITITDNILTCKQTINSYHASFIAEFFRELLLKNKSTFSFETVMSHHSKVEFLEKAKTEGFKTYLYFICTQDPRINIQRVKNRVKKGGHAVNEDKIISRYYKCLDLLYEAFMKADRAFILDNSNQNRDLILEKKDDEIIIHNEIIPDWINQYLLNKLTLE